MALTMEMERNVDKDKLREAEQLAKDLMTVLSKLQAEEEDAEQRIEFSNLATWSNHIRDRMYILMTKEGQP